VAIVTGGASGIGRASALELARNGADVLIYDVACPDIAAAVLEEIRATGRRACFQQGDVASRDDVAQMIDAAVQILGRVDILVNNAAFSVRKPLLELEVADVQRVWDVSQWGVFHCSQLAARQMVKQGGGGNIVAITSVHVQRPFANSTAYNAAKAAVECMARTWALELAPYGIRVNIVEPGWIDTPGERRYGTDEQRREGGRKLPLGRLGTPEDIAKVVAFVASPDASYMTGSVLRVDGGFVLPHA
jgi:glucose 1-dehydrogenase